jgi:hypothetical protein
MELLVVSVFVREGMLLFCGLAFPSSLSLRKIKHLRCKHVAAVLLAVVCIKTYSESPTAPKNESVNLKRSNVERFANCSNSVKEAVDMDLTWTEIVENFLLDPDKRRPGASNNDKILTAPRQPKSSEKKHYATLEDTPMKELKSILRSIHPSMKTTGKKKELIERVARNRPIAPSVNARPDSTVPVLAAEDMTKSKKTKRAVADDPIITANKRTRREIADLTMETARFLGNRPEKRKITLSSRS